MTFSKKEPQVEPVAVEGRFSGDAVIDEHFVPSASLSLESAIEKRDLTAIHHLVRYRWAESVLRSSSEGSRVLDLGCGDGYGAATIARAHPGLRVTATDFDPAAISAAKDRYQLPNLTFQVGNSMEWSETIGPGVWDVIVCFEVLEHVPHRELLMEGVVEHMPPEGKLLFSTPSAHRENLVSPPWPHHKIEYCASSLFDFLRRYFGEVSGRDRPGFPCAEVFAPLLEKGIDYAPTLNPACCQRPVRVMNPYRGG